MKTFKVIDDNTVEMDGVVYKKEQTLPSEPEFKVGDWIVGVGYPNERSYYPQKPHRVTKVEGRRVYYTNTDGETASQTIGIRHATPAEIESHLRKICDEKYVGKRVKCLCHGEYTVSNSSEYVDSEDAMWYEAVGTSDEVMVYQNGEWAEILPDKKALPKTKDEFTVFCDKYHDQCSLPFGDSTEEFLDQYDFND